MARLRKKTAPLPARRVREAGLANETGAGSPGRRRLRNAASRNGPAVVVAADSVRARLFRADDPDAPLEELEDLVNPQSGMHEGDLVEDSTGWRGR